MQSQTRRSPFDYPLFRNKSNDVLYIQSAEDDCVPALLDLAKQW